MPKKKDEDDDEDDDDEDFDDEDDSLKTKEGGIIMGLVNMQLRPLLKDYLPEIKIDFKKKNKKSRGKNSDS